MGLNGFETDEAIRALQGEILAEAHKIGDQMHYEGQGLAPHSVQLATAKIARKYKLDADIVWGEIAKWRSAHQVKSPKKKKIKEQDLGKLYASLPAIVEPVTSEGMHLATGIEEVLEPSQYRLALSSEEVPETDMFTERMYIEDDLLKFLRTIPPYKTYRQIWPSTEMAEKARVMIKSMVKLLKWRKNNGRYSYRARVEGKYLIVQRR